MIRHVLSLVPELSISTWSPCGEGAAVGVLVVSGGPVVAVDP